MKIITHNSVLIKKSAISKLWSWDAIWQSFYSSMTFTKHNIDTVVAGYFNFVFFPSPNIDIQCRIKVALTCDVVVTHLKFLKKD